METLVLKTGALGDVLRTTAILPGWKRAWPEDRIVWVTAPAAADLVRSHPSVDETLTVSPKDEEALGLLGEELARRSWRRVLSFDDEEGLCRLASRVVPAVHTGVLSGAYLDGEGERRYTDDVAPWFDMGLLSRFGKEEADRRKVANRESHPAIFARMLGIEAGEPELPLSDELRHRASALLADSPLAGADGPLVGLNTGAGGRWESKRLPIERTVELVLDLDRRLAGQVRFLLLGGPEEEERNAAIRSAVGTRARLFDPGNDLPLLPFAALVDRCDLLVTSDSLALHVANARRVPTVAFFAPTSAAEIELYGRGEKVASTAPDACSYRPDADTSTLTVERLAGAAARVLAARTTAGR